MITSTPSLAAAFDLLEQAMPPCMQVLGLLRGLTAALDVAQSYLDVMTPYARQVRG
jgi:hypothetical protein